ncbi:MAG: hypothetical protein Q4E54_00455 [Lachnospiraceae bacterium]|nr:hypothetical protein [Lachnospiraceae bacterium]
MFADKYREALAHSRLIPGDVFKHAELEVDRKMSSVMAEQYSEYVVSHKDESAALTDLAKKCFGGALLLRLMAIDEQKDISALSQDEIGQVIGSYINADTFRAVFDAIPSLKETGKLIEAAIEEIAGKVEIDKEAVADYMQQSYNQELHFLKSFRGWVDFRINVEQRL